MSEVSPMRGRRVRKIRCPVEGHGHGRCEVVDWAAPPDRTQEEKEWQREWRREGSAQ